MTTSSSNLSIFTLIELCKTYMSGHTEMQPLNPVVRENISWWCSAHVIPPPADIHPNYLQAFYLKKLTNQAFIASQTNQLSRKRK